MTPFFTMEYFTHRPFFFTLVFDTDKDYSKAKTKWRRFLFIVNLRSS